MKTILNNFLRGFLLILPISLTLYIIYAFLSWINNLLNSLLFEPFNIHIPGLGIVTVFIAITLFGFICGLAFTRPIVGFFEQLISRTPLVKVIYTSIKELTEAIFGENKKFNQPVLVELNGHGVNKLGFITQSDLSELGLHDLVSVYCPHSYNFSGNLFLVSPDHITSIDTNSSKLMRYIISGGITRIQDQLPSAGNQHESKQEGREA